MNIIVTIPLHRLDISRQEDKAVRGLSDEECNWYWLLKPKPKILSVGERIYFVENGLIAAWCPVMELGNFDFVCQVSGRRWAGFQARLGQNREFLHPIAYKGFQGWRYMKPRFRARLDALEVESSCEPLLPPAMRSDANDAISRLKIIRACAKHQVDFVESILRDASKNEERVIVSTAHRRHAEDLSGYLNELGFATKYFHREIAPRYRKKIAKEFQEYRTAIITADTLEGLPSSETVVIMDADHRSELRTKEWLQYNAVFAKKQVIVCADRLSATLRTVFPQLK